MSRAYCYRCNRVLADCLCDQAEAIDNRLKVIVLQHPDEKKHSKNSAIIASLCLKNYQCWTGENFSDHDELNRSLAENKATTVVVYPAEYATDVNTYLAQVSETGSKISQLVFIDATWRKAKKIWTLSENLHVLPAIKLPADISSNYRIRKLPGQGYLSTAEAIYYSLSIIEDESERYRLMLELFDQMIDRQIEHMGEATYQNNYVSKNV